MDIVFKKSKSLTPPDSYIQYIPYITIHSPSPPQLSPRSKKREKAKEYYQKNRDRFQEYGKKYYRKNRDYFQTYSKDYYQKNKTAIQQQQREYFQKRSKN
jgi:hypothetical protein